MDLHCMVWCVALALIIGCSVLTFALHLYLQILYIYIICMICKSQESW
jgi:hypothetical protein